MEFKDKLKQLRSEKGISQQELADAIHISRSAVAKWENGLGFPSRDSMEALMAYFQVDDGYFSTEEPESVIVSKNRNIRMLKTILAWIAVVILGINLFLGCAWMSSVDGEDLVGLAREAGDYLGHKDLEIVELTRRGDYMAALCRDPEGNWSMCVFDRDEIFGSRWVAGGGKKQLDAGEIGSWNYGSPAGEAVLIFCGGDLSDEIRWYRFENSGIEYTCSVDGGTVLDIFIILDQNNINGSATPLDQAKEPIK